MTKRQAIACGAPTDMPAAEYRPSLAVRFWSDTSGATAIEYGLIAGLTFLAIAGALHLYAERMNVMYDYIGTHVGRATS